MWWGVGPALEIWALAGFVWLATRRRALAAVSLAVPIGYYAAAGQTIAPMIRYLLPLTPALAVAAGVLSADWLRRPRLRLVAAVATVLVLGTSALYAGAYMNVYRRPDSRIAAARYIERAIPRGARVMVEPSHNIPPMGAYLTNVNFYGDYVLWGRSAPRDDYFHQFSLDTYVYLYDPRHTDEQKRDYIAGRLAQAEWIVMDDTYVEFYEHLPEAQHAVVKQYYRDLFSGRLGFDLARTWRVYPSLFGISINDDDAELTFRLFDHPRVFVFKRRAAGAGNWRGRRPHGSRAPRSAVSSGRGAVLLADHAVAAGRAEPGAPASPTPPPPPPPPPAPRLRITRILAFGDSLTEGEATPALWGMHAAQFAGPVEVVPVQAPDADQRAIHGPDD